LLLEPPFTVRVTDLLAMADSAIRDEPRVSKAPIWVALGLGLLLVYLNWPYPLGGTLVLAFVIGYAIYLSQRFSAIWRALALRNDELVQRIGKLERDIAALEARGQRPVAEPEVDAAAAPTAAPASPVPPVMTTTPARVAAPESIAPVMETASGATEAPAPAGQYAPQPVDSRPTATPRRPAAPSMFERGFSSAKAWLLGGNTVARVGLLVLFVGVAFLLRYVAERTHFPIELRLLAVALGALGFLALGWRLRARRPGFAITLQGGAVGILYLTAFAAMRLYGVLPPLAAFAFMALLAVLSGVLAILQNARALAALGSTGGFLAPLLVSTGEGRIGVLFSYYLLLNCGVLGIAWFRAWRELNWIGFVFTFGVSGLWAVHRYTPQDFLVGQGFLIAFWLLFLVVSLLYALRQPDSRRGIFDASLVFALPLAAFGIQTRYMHGLELALASVVAAATYLGASTWLLWRRDPALRLLTEACFALGIGFLTLAIPLAASAQWTAAAWALEGLALLWVGLRQGRLVPVLAGLALHVLAALALLHAVVQGDIDIAPQWSGLTLNLVVLVATAFVSSILLARSVPPQALPKSVFAALAWIARVIAWAWVAMLIWQPLAFPWYAFGWCAAALAMLACDRRREHAAAASPEWVVGMALVVLAAVAAETRLAVDSWAASKLLLRLTVSATAVSASLLTLRGAEAARRAAAAALLTLGVIAWLVTVVAQVLARIDAPLAAAQLSLVLIGVTSLALAWLGGRLKWDWPHRLGWSFFAALLVLAAYAVALAVFLGTLPSRDYGWALWPIAWALFYLRLGAQGRADVPVPAVGALHVAGLWLLTAMIAAEFALRLDRVAGDGWFHAAWGAIAALALWLTVQYSARWPMRTAPRAYAEIGVPGLAVMTALWLLWATVRSDGDPSPLRALPLANPLDLASLAALGALVRWYLADSRPAWPQPTLRALIGAIAFFAVNIIALRAVHFVTGVAWDASALGRSLVVQSVLSLLWTVTAMGLMVAGNRHGMRTLWLVGAALLAVVVAKLFFVDLSGRGTIERIVSFLGVGALLLVIGYLAPVPPATAAARRTDATS